MLIAGLRKVRIRSMDFFQKVFPVAFFGCSYCNRSSCWIFFGLITIFHVFLSTQVGRVKVPWQLWIWVDDFHHLQSTEKDLYIAAWDSQHPTNEQRFIDFIGFIVLSGDGIRVDAKDMCTDVPINPSVSMGTLARKKCHIAQH